MAKKQRGISPDGTELLDFSSNPFPTYYRHQDGDKQVKMRGHVDQDDTEITIVLPRVSGSLAIIGDGGSIDLSDYYTKGEVEALINDLDVEIKNDYYDKAEIDKILSDLDGGSDDLQAQLDALEVLVTKNTADISDNSMKISLNESAINDNKDKIKENEDAIQLNTTGINKNKKDISDLQAQINAGKDKASQYVWKEPSNYERPPDEGCLYAGNGVGFVDEIKLTEYLYMSKLDDDVVFHNLEAIEKGDVIESDLGGDHPAHGVFEVDSVEMISDTYAKIKVMVIRSAGNWSDQNRTSDVDSWSISFMLGLEVEASNYYSKNETDNLFTPITAFDDHEKRNAASFVLLEAEISRVAGEVLLNYNDITILYEDKIPAIQKDIEENATAIEANTEALSGYMPLDGNSIKTGKLTLKTDDPTPMSIKTGNGTPLINVWSSGAISLEKPYSEFKNNELVTKAYVDGKVAEGGGGGSEGFPALPEYDYYYLDVAGTTSGRLTLLDSDSKRTSDLNRVRLIAFHGVDKNGKRWARDKDIVSYDRPFSGTLNLLTEEGKVIMTVCSSGKATGIVTQNYFKDAISGFCGPDNYMFDIPNSECVTLPTSVSTISYPQKVYLHVTGLHF